MAAARILALALFGVAVVANAGSLLKPTASADALLPVDEAFVFHGVSREQGQIALDWSIAPGYYLYNHMFKVTVEGVAGAPPALSLPKGETKQDAEFGEVTVQRGALHVPLTVATGAATPRTLRVRYQGCADMGVCYPPQTRLVAVK
jgi:thiol:disulfide interchange protein DsbD